MIEVLVSLLLLFGGALVLVAGVGILRLPDVLCRAHATAKASTLGIFSLLIALWALLGVGSVGLKIALAIFFQVTTIPLASHLVSLLALRKNLPRWKARPFHGQAAASGEGPPGA